MTRGTKEGTQAPGGHRKEVSHCTQSQAITYWKHVPKCKTNEAKAVARVVEPSGEPHTSQGQNQVQRPQDRGQAVKKKRFPETPQTREAEPKVCCSWRCTADHVLTPGESSPNPQA